MRPLGKPEGIVHFVGGAFFGIAPQITYRNLLECLAERGFLVIATPYRVRFDRSIAANSSLAIFDGAYSQLVAQDVSLAQLPVFGIGHSLGSFLLLLMSSENTVRRSGLILLSFNNKSAEKVKPEAFFIETVV